MKSKIFIQCFAIQIFIVTIYTEKSLIYAESEHDVAITGQGTIDGQGQEFSGPYLKRPYGIRFVTCTDVRVENVTLRNSAMWMQHYLACDRVTIRGIKVWNQAVSEIVHESGILKKILVSLKLTNF